MKYDQFKQWAEEHGWLLFAKASDPPWQSHRWLTPAGEYVAVLMEEDGEGIRISPADFEEFLDTTGT